MTLRAASRYAGKVTGVVATSDDGGSSGRLRTLLGIIPPGDLRKCLVALADPASSFTRAFEYRFATGELSGHALGNLILAALVETSGSTLDAVDTAARLLGATGRVIPASTTPVTLCAEGAHGVVKGQVAVNATKEIRRIFLDPENAVAPAEALSSLLDADQILIGPGSLFTSVLAALVVPAVNEAFNEATGQKVYIANLHPQVGETQDYDVADHVRALQRHKVSVDVVVCDTASIPLGELDLPYVDRRLAKPNGLAHDFTALASVLVDLIS
jgi:uncharacterized cofD-like protein